jgi:hypothetical protein
MELYKDISREFHHVLFNIASNLTQPLHMLIKKGTK